MNDSEYEKDIAERRRIMRPSPVRQQHVPNWFRLALLKAFGCRDGLTYGFYVLDHAIRQVSGGHAHWLDHWGSTRIGTREYFVIEPYQLCEEEIEEISTLARKADCRWHFSSNSWWNPGATIRVVFEPKQGDANLIRKASRSDATR